MIILNSFYRVSYKFRLYDSLQGLVPVLTGIIISKSNLDLSFIIFFIFVAFIQQFFIYNYNDYCDHEMDKINPRKKVHLYWQTSNGKKILLSTLLFGIISPFFFNWSSALFLLFSFFICIFYSYPSLRFKESPLISLLCHFLFGSFYFLSGYCLGVPESQMLIFNIPKIFPLYFGLLFLSGGIFGQIIDLPFDKNLRPSFPKKLGLKNTYFIVGVIHFLIFLISKNLMLGSDYEIFIYPLFLIYLIIFLLFLKKREDQKYLILFKSNYRVIFGIMTYLLVQHSL